MLILAWFSEAHFIGILFCNDPSGNTTLIRGSLHIHVYSIPHNHYKVTVDMYLGVFMWTEIPNSQIHIPSVTDWLFDQLIVSL